jgi:hypothetical protein
MLLLATSTAMSGLWLASTKQERNGSDLGNKQDTEHVFFEFKRIIITIRVGGPIAHSDATLPVEPLH